MKLSELNVYAAIGVSAGVASGLLFHLKVPLLWSYALGAVLVVILTNGAGSRRR